ASGSFVHTIVDVNGCSSDIAFSLTAPPVFAVDTSFVYPDCNNNFGYLHLDASGGIGPYSIQNGQTTISFADTITFTLIPGSYSYTISDSLGCLENIAFSIDPVNAVLGYIQANNTNCNGDSSGSLKIVMTRGAAPYIINGISFLDSTILINLPAGSYQFDVTDANNCSIALNAIILQPGTLLVDSIVIASNITCEGLNDAVIQVIASGGTPAYTYVLISPTGDTVSQNGNVFGALGTGTYTAIVIDSFGCVSLSSIFIPPFFDATQRIEQDSVSCYGKQDGAIKIYSEPTERNPYMYSLNGGSPQVYNVFYNLGAGDYWIVVYDKNNCTDTLNVTMAQPDSIDSKVWLNGELLPVDSLDLDERMYADFTKQNFHPWEISFSPDVTRIDESLSLIRIQPRESITFTVMIYMDSFDTNCFVEYNGLIDLRNVAPVPNIITPNNDGFNDLWEIDLDKFPSPEVTIFNRWGEIIFRSENYTNNWNGLYRDKHVADGTYFYLLKVPSHNNKVYKGNINVLNSAR
ncbi:MAG: gliding motility-associated C-terminal domain-containing protein, partial [Bacteroidota bacterium]